MSLRHLTFFVIGLASVLMFAGCRSSRANSPSVPQGSRTALDVLIQEGSAADMQDRQYKYRQELRAYMERDLPRRFARYGFDVKILRQPGEYQPTLGHHLLTIRYDAYNPGSAAARYTVGYGAGAASLDLTASLQKGNAPALSWKDGCGTSGHWSRIVNKLDDNMAKKLREVFANR